MKYKLVVFDIDGTITRHISSWRFIHEELDLWNVLAKKYQEQFLAGKISYRRFCELDAAHWKGISAENIYEIFKKVRYSKNAKKVIKQLKQKGFKLAALSTGLQFVTEKVKDELGLDFVLGNRLNTRKGLVTGGVTINIGHGGKGRAMKNILYRFKVKASETIAVGDSDGDIPMIRSAGFSIAFNSSSDRLSHIVDHDCKTLDFQEVGRKILEVSF